MILALRRPESESPTTPLTNGNGNDPAVTVGVVSAITVGIGFVFLCVVCFSYRRGKKSATAAEDGDDDGIQLQTDHPVGDERQAPGMPTNKPWWQDESWGTELGGYEYPVEAPATPLIERRAAELEAFPPPLRMATATKNWPGHERKDSQGSATILVGENQGQKKNARKWLGGNWLYFSG